MGHRDMERRCVLIWRFGIFVKRSTGECNHNRQYGKGGKTNHKPLIEWCARQELNLQPPDP